MDLPSSHVFEVLTEKTVEELHHVNSVATACQFIRSKSLMSRGNVERMGFAQTRQASDEIDKRYGIWFDVFVDSVDIHHRARRANVYGPVLFVFDINIINKNGTGRLWVTKLNPTKWVGKPDNRRWFQDRNDLEENFVKGEFDQMIVLRHCGGALPFGTYLRKIILDDPGFRNDDEIDLYSMSVGALRLAMQDAKIDVPIERRQCRDRCTCSTYWNENNERRSHMFDPKI